ncbi:MAG: DUF4190 domain-containing protein [Micropruina sp.]
MSNEQYSPWASGDGFGTPRPQPTRSDETPAREQPTTADYTNPVPPPHDPTEPSGWSQPQQFGALASQPGYPPPSVAYSFGQRLPYGAAGDLPEHPLATTTLILGIVGLAAMFAAFPFISPVAWILGARARREMRAEPGRYRASGSLTAGYTLGILGSVITLIFVTVIVLAIILFAI